ncbi:MAG: type II secretion system protein GspG [Chlamydiae bacterium]|nr:type II secretion system protein GspG [Chlamydiota bacterium]MBI3276879.1 type II secretion system protein GspG [Chlamydiota bacterium]
MKYNMRLKRSKSLRFLTGFTIIEMLVVISVIAILASILLPALSSAQKKAKITKTQTMIDTITVALKQYRTDFGDFPPTTIPGVTGPVSAECLYYYTAATFVAGSSNSNIISTGPYMEYRAKDLGTTGDTANVDGSNSAVEALYRVIDPWGNNLQYIQPGTHNTSSFDIYSYGPDGQTGIGEDKTKDDITNW